VTLHLKPAGQALRDQLADLDANMGLLDGGEMPVEQARAILALAQVKATAALVHAVRELTEAVRARR
jgi:hypothetical protein